MLAYPLSPGRLCLPDQAVSTLNCSRSWQCHQLHIRFVATATPPLKGGALSPAFRLCLSLYLSMSVCLCLTLLLCNFVSVSLSLCLSVSVSLHLCISFSFHEAALHSLSLSLPSPSKKTLHTSTVCKVCASLSHLLWVLLVPTSQGLSCTIFQHWFWDSAGTSQHPEAWWDPGPSSSTTALLLQLMDRWTPPSNTDMIGDFLFSYHGPTNQDHSLNCGFSHFGSIPELGNHVSLRLRVPPNSHPHYELMYANKIYVRFVTTYCTFGLKYSLYGDKGLRLWTAE